MRGFEDDDRLVRLGNNRLSDGDEVPLRIENAKARGFPIARIELRGRALSESRVAGLNLRERNIEFRTVTDATLDDGQDSGARKIGQKTFQTNHALGETARTGSFRQFFKRDGLVERKFADGGADDFRQVSA